MAYRLFLGVGIYFLAAGFVGFLALATSAEGVFDWLGSSVEWPVGYSEGVAQTSDGHYIATNQMAGRIQFYDHNWKFLWGKRIDSGGGIFKIISVKEDCFEVVTARLNNRYTVDYKGIVLSKANYPESVRYSEFGIVGHSTWVPTYLFLLPFASPSFAFFSILLGSAILVFTATVIRNRLQSGTVAVLHRRFPGL